MLISLPSCWDCVEELRRALMRTSREEYPFRPREPLLKAVLIPDHVSPGSPSTGPEYCRGHSPVRSRCLFAQVRICSTARGGKILGVAHITMLSEQFTQRRTAGHAAPTVSQGLLDPVPSLSRPSRYRARLDLRPLSCALVVFVGPSQDLSDRQEWQVHPVSHAAVFGEQLGKRRAAWQTANTFAQGHVNRLPGYVGCSANPTGVLAWPFAETRENACQTKRRISLFVRWGKSFLFRTPRCSASSFAREIFPGRPRSPRLRAALIPDHERSGKPSTSPVLFVGQFPVV